MPTSSNPTFLPPNFAPPKIQNKILTNIYSVYVMPLFASSNLKQNLALCMTPTNNKERLPLYFALAADKEMCSTWRRKRRIAQYQIPQNRSLYAHLGGMWTPVTYDILFVNLQFQDENDFGGRLKHLLQADDLAVRQLTQYFNLTDDIFSTRPTPTGGIATFLHKLASEVSSTATFCHSLDLWKLTAVGRNWNHIFVILSLLYYGFNCSSDIIGNIKCTFTQGLPLTFSVTNQQDQLACHFTIPQAFLTSPHSVWKRCFSTLN